MLFYDSSRAEGCHHPAPRPSCSNLCPLTECAALFPTTPSLLHLNLGAAFFLFSLLLYAWNECCSFLIRTFAGIIGYEWFFDACSSPSCCPPAGPFSPGGYFQCNALSFYCGYACSLLPSCSVSVLAIWKYFPWLKNLKLISCSEQVPSSCHLCLLSSAESLYFLYFLLSLLHSSLYFPKATELWTKSLGLAFWVLKQPPFGPTYFHTFPQSCHLYPCGDFFLPLSDAVVLLYPGGIYANRLETWGFFRQRDMQKSHHERILSRSGNVVSAAAACFPSTQVLWNPTLLSLETLLLSKYLRADTAFAWESCCSYYSTGDPETSMGPGVRCKANVWSQSFLWDCASVSFWKANGKEGTA